MWFDRITSEVLSELPNIIESSRYIASDSVVVNGHTTLEAGDLLVDDGSGRFLGLERDSVFFAGEVAPSQDVQVDVVISALMEFDNATKEGRDCSFLLPEKLLSWLHLTSLDEAILNVIERGHLHEIVRNPNMDIVYQERLLPIGRVKRIPALATRHLAARW